jgi:hypothetical protein
MTTDEFFGEHLDAAIAAAVEHARDETLRCGVPVFYQDETGLEIMEQPDGRKFEIRYIPGAPMDHNYIVLRELQSAA